MHSTSSTNNIIESADILRATTLVRRVATSELRLGMHIHKLGVSWLKHPFLRNSFQLTDPKDLQAIIDAGITEAWIDEELSAPQQRDLPEPVQLQESQPAHTRIRNTPDNEREVLTSMDEEVGRARKICLAAKDQVTSMFKDVRLGNAVSAGSTIPLVKEIAASVARNNAALISVARLKTHDDYTYLHSVAVCALMVSLAKQLNLNEEQIALAGLAGLMHDLGKAKMPLETLNKRGKLTDAEFAIMKRHPAAGAELLRDGGAPDEVQDVALHHHEKINGTGYPDGLTGNEITTLARMGAVCDVYDAVTSERPYKHAWDPASAIAQMAKWEGHFDKQIFHAFVRAVGIYPVGSLVRLQSQRLAVIVEPGTESLLKPRVRAFFSLRSNETTPIQYIDLGASGCTDSIVGLEDPARWSFNKFRNLDELWMK